MTLSDLIQNIIDSTKDRIKNPIVGAFICSFVVYNWRPFFLLMFSNMKMEEKIVIINNEYCSLSSFIYPFIFAIIYTLIVPFIMIYIDAILIYAKKQRVENIYKNKSIVLEEKIKLAAKVLKLKEAESGNKEKQDLIDKIKSLEESNQLLTLSEKNKIEQLNNSLRDVNQSLVDSMSENEKHLDTIQKLQIQEKVNKEKQGMIRYDAFETYRKLSPQQRVDLARIVGEHNDIKFGLISVEQMSEFVTLKIIEVNDKQDYVLTEMGREVYISVLTHIKSGPIIKED